MAPDTANRLQNASAIEPARRTDVEGNEWGFFDPERCGLAAVLARIGATTAPETPDAEAERTQARVVQSRSDEDG